MRAPRRADGCVALVVCAAAACQPAPSPAVDAPAVGASSADLRAPVDFEFESLDGRPVSSAAGRGNVSVLTFVTTGSILAQAQVDFLVAMAKHDAGTVHYALVALEDRANRELVGIYARTLSVPFPVAVADVPTLQGAGPFGDVTSVPVTVVLDRNGRVVLRAEGRVVKSDELRAAMRGL
jgi:hypothetical protein